MAKREDGIEKIGREVSVQAAYRGCIDKRRYPSKTKARDEAKKIQRRTNEEAAMRPYRCAVCSGWHLTSATPYGLSRRPQEAKRA